MLVVPLSDKKEVISAYWRIPIPPKLAAIFKSLRIDDRIGKLFDVSEDVLHTEFRKAVAAAGIQEFRFHDLRHTFASHFVMRTNDLPTLQKLLGHYVVSPVMCSVVAFVQGTFTDRDVDFRCGDGHHFG